MDRDYDGIKLRLDSLSEAQGISDYIRNTARLVSSPTLGIDQMTTFQVATVQEICGGLVTNEVEVTSDKPYRVDFPSERIRCFKKYVSATLEHAKTVGCSDSQIFCINEAIKYLS